MSTIIIISPPPPINPQSAPTSKKGRKHQVGPRSVEFIDGKPSFGDLCGSLVAVCRAWWRKR